MSVEKQFTFRVISSHRVGGIKMSCTVRRYSSNFPGNGAIYRWSRVIMEISEMHPIDFEQ